jgi:hypothetical protein
MLFRIQVLKRSVRELPRAAEMLRQQLMHADKIHFLNDHDLTNFSKTIKSFKLGSTSIKFHRMVPGSWVDRLSGDYQVERLSFKASDTLNSLEDKCVMVSGIYTVDPLTDNEILCNVREDRGNEVEPTRLDPDSVEEEKTADRSPGREAAAAGAGSGSDLVVEKLIDRPKNILCFGLIRGDKGIDEAIDLAKKLKDLGKRETIIIAGKFMGSIDFLSIISCKIYGKKFSIGSKIKKILIDTHKLSRDFVNENNLYNIFVHYSPQFNEACNVLFKQEDMAKKLQENCLEIHFDVSDEDLKSIAMRCRYAIKYDNKGMANNASTIASCLGFYLPTFTYSGLVTGDEFRTLHHVDSEKERKSSKELPTTPSFSDTVIMGRKKYEFELKKAEVRPSKDVDKLLGMIIEEFDDREKYQTRIQAIRKLKEGQVFDVSRVAKKIYEKVFLTREHSMDVEIGAGR